MKLHLLLLLVISCLGFTLQSDYNQVGKASFYSSKFEGRKTSSGEVFKQGNLTAAHKTLPFGTLLKVTNLKNDSTVVVKVNDRLSKGSSSIIDLTLSAAKKLNFVRYGHTQVKLETQR